MSEQAHGRGQDQGMPDGRDPLGPPSPGRSGPGRSGPGRSMSGLFDFRFDSFVAPKLIRSLYTLIVVVTLLSALIWVIVAFRVNAALGVLVLVTAAPLSTIIIIGIWRVVLEFFMAVLRMSEDIRALRETGRSSLSWSCGSLRLILFQPKRTRWLVRATAIEATTVCRDLQTCLTRDVMKR